MTRLRLAAASLNTTPLDWQGNLRVIRAALRAAQEANAGILCLPELCITGYGCEDMFFSAGVRQTALETLPELAAETGGLVACFGLPVFFEGEIYNGAAVACDGRLLGIVAKHHLAGDGIHYEPRWFRSWPVGKVGVVEVGGEAVPIGDLLFDCGGVRIGLEICRDAWLPNRTGIQLAARGAQVILNPSASHFAFAKQQIREQFVLAATQRLGVSYAYCNLLGNEAGRAIYDGGTLIASGGRMLVRGPRFSFADWVLTTAVIDVDGGVRRANGEHDQVGVKQGCVIAELQYPHVAEASGTITVQTNNSDASFADQVQMQIPGHPQWETGPHQKEEEFARSVALGLFDYLRKSRMRGFLVSLSGGADSSAVVVLIHLMLQFAGREIGWPEVIRKLPLARDGAGILPESMSYKESFDETSRRLMGQLLSAVYQSTRNSGPETLSSAKTIADVVGAQFWEWNVDAIIDEYVDIVAAAAGRPLTWEQDDVALQNIQARARGPGAWLLANLRGALLLTTSNRSEAAVGYATMDGDTCGGLAPIAGIDKAYLLEWLKWMEEIGPAGIGQLPALSIVNRQRPTAELRPPGAEQTDEGDLMPYRVLDAIERAAIRDKLLPVAVYEAVRPEFSEYPPQQMAAWVERFFQLWCKNQWKRERYAPSFHLDDENLDPKTWCRFPILNGGFEQELKELRQHVTQK